MKISPVGAGMGSVALAQGAAPQVQAPTSVQRLRMATNASPERFLQESQAESAIPDSSGQTNEASEETKPLSPQYAQLAKQRRALQVKERELAEKEKALTAQPQGGLDLAKLKADPLSILEQAGVTYDQLTEAILASQGGMTPEVRALKEELKALKEGVDSKFTDRDTQAEKQVLAEMQKEATQLAGEGDAFELVRETKSIPQVMKLIKRTYREEGEVLDVSEALQLIEDELLKESLKLARLGKVQSSFAPSAPQQPQPQRPRMTTLTNRDTARSIMSAKARAIAAFNGTLRK